MQNTICVLSFIFYFRFVFVMNLKQQSLDHLLSLIQSLQQSNSQLTCITQKYRKQIQKKQKWSKSEISLLIQQNTRILGLNSKLQHSIVKLETKLRQKQAIINDLKTKGAGIQCKLIEVENEYGGFWTEMSMVKNKNTQLQSKINKLKDEIKEKDIRIGYLQNELEFRRKQTNAVNRRAISRDRNLNMSQSRSNVHRVNTSTNVRKNKSRNSVSLSKNKLKQQIQQTICTLDEMKALSQYQQTYTKEQLKIKHQQFLMLKEECQRVKQIYEQEIGILKRQNKQLLKEIRQKTQRRDQEKGTQYKYMQLINNCLVFKLPYIESIKQTISNSKQQIITIVENIELILTDFQDSKRLQQEQLFELNEAIQVKYIDEIQILNKKIQSIKYQQQEQSQKLGQQFNQLEEQRLRMIDSLHQQIKEQQNIIQQFQEEKHGAIHKIYTSNTLDETKTQKDRQIVLKMYEMNEQNEHYKLKNFEIMQLLEGLLYFIACIIIQMDSKSKTDKYYRICEQYYWGMKSKQPNAFIFKQTSAKRTLRKVCRSIFFVSCLKVSKAKRIKNQKLVISDFTQYQGSKRFLNLFAQYSDFSNRQQNKAIEQFKFKGSSNIFTEMMNMIVTEINNKRIVECQNQKCLEIGWVLFQQSVNNQIMERRIGNEGLKGMTSSRSVGMFKKTKMNEYN